MVALSQSESLGSQCRQALRCLHQLFWGCLWPSRGSFQFSQALTLVSLNGGGFSIFWLSWDFHIFIYSIGYHILRINPIDSVVLVIEELEYFDCNLNLMVSFLSGLCFSCRWTQRIFRPSLQKFLFALSFSLCINILYSLSVRMHMEEVNSLIQFFFILKTLTKSSNGLRTYCFVTG